GFRRRCPRCGVGHMFSGYLKVADRCDHCGEELFHQRADDAPPYFTMLIVGHVVVAGVLSMEQTIAPPMWVQMAVWLPLTAILSLLLLPVIKGSLVGLQWALRMHGFGSGADPADPLPDPALAVAQNADRTVR
ncbi:MAG: DUF983 domain-containing protein, partial [Hyphomicrobiaceae bacterium]